jgi:hypothetical protein
MDEIIPKQQNIVAILPDTQPHVQETKENTYSSRDEH